MTVFYLGLGLSLIASGLVATPFMLAAGLAVAGLFAAIYHPIGTAMLVEVAGDRPGRALGLNGVCGNVGVALAPVATAFLVAQGSWRAAFIVPGIACFGLGLLWLRVPAYDPDARGASQPFPEIPKALVRRAVIVLLLIAIVSGLVFNAFTLLLPKLMEERAASSPGMLPLIGVFAFVATLCGAATQLTVGRLIDRMTLKSLFLPLGLVLVPALVALAFVQGWMVVPAAGLVAAVVFGQVTLNETMTARYISPRLRTRMYSIRFFVGFLGSAAAAPLVGGLHERTGNLTAATLVLAVFALITLGCAVFFPDRREELRPELWARAGSDLPAGAVPAAAE
jgi:MFS family permease